MIERKLLAFEFAKDASKLLVTLSTAILTLSITFYEKVIGSCPEQIEKNILIGSWFFFLFSIFFGAWSLLALTGNLDPMHQTGEQKEDMTEDEKKSEVDVLTINTPNVRIPYAGQLICFCFGHLLTVIFGFFALN